MPLMIPADMSLPGSLTQTLQSEQQLPVPPGTPAFPTTVRGDHDRAVSQGVDEKPAAPTSRENLCL